MGGFAFEGLYKPDGAGSKQHEEAQGPMPRPNRLVVLKDCKSQSLKNLRKPCIITCLYN